MKSHLHFGVCAVLEEGADEGLVAVLGRHVDRRLAAVVRQVHLGAVLQQRLAAVEPA